MSRAGHAEVRRDRPGPGRMSQALLRALDLDIKRRIDGLMPGSYRSTALGTGFEIAQVRPYVPGDDVRRIDWNVTARTNEVHVRVQVPERSTTTWIVLDASASMHFGTADRRKADVAEGVSLAAAHIGSRGGNRVGLIAFGGQQERVMPPSQQSVGITRTLGTLRDAPLPDAPGSTLGSALARAARTLRRGGVAFVVSDWREDVAEWQRPLRLLVQHQHVLAVEVRDPRELWLPDIGDTYFVDFETGRQIRVDTSDKRVRDRFASAARAERAEVGRAVRATGAHHVVLSTEGDWLRPLATFLRKGRRKRL
ncbi:MAG: DUF58 domain-containing protein, partial [Actinomycetota bacterium]